MRRTCERPGCAEPASVAFGMVPEDLVVWLAACDPATLGDDRPGLLCRRHADAMVVPMGWTLDDHREPIPRLFKVREAPAAPRPAGDHTGRTRRPKIQQASLLDLEQPEPAAADAAPGTTAADTVPSPVGPLNETAPMPGDAAPAPDEPAPFEPAPVAEATADTAASGEPAWTPTFDRNDDLDGLLAPRGKLLRRAFGAEPPR